MNVENMLKVANEIEQHPEHFSMASPLQPNYNCGTVGCIAGYTKIFGPSSMREAGDYLGLTCYQQRQLFYCGKVWGKYLKELGLTASVVHNGCTFESVEPRHAVTMLRNLASGKWSF